jgi:predicted RNA-binding Zn-ribbon protein involved in translation (DUF1610 family)
MADPVDPLIHTCTSCGALIDVSEQEPLSLVHCPSCGTGARVRTQFHHFQLQEVLGAGGMGAVYRAFDANLNRFVALKLLRKEYSNDQEFVAQFKREAAITASINHPHVVKVYSASEDQGLVYIAMELVDKGSLDDLMNLQGKVAEAQVLEVGIQIAQGLDAALRRGLIHRDIKPGNILFADAHTAKIVDFGLATLQEQASKAAGEVWGTPYYVAPEKLDVPPVEDFRSDMYSLGATLFHAVAGRPPFEAETASMVALKHLKSQAVSLQAFAPEVSSATAFVINKTLHKDPDQRYASYEELIEHLTYAREELLKNAGKAQRRAQVRIDHSDDARAMSWITFGMIAVVVLGGVGAWIMRDSLFGAGEGRPNAAVEQQKSRLADLEPRFVAARQLITGRNFSAAAGEFLEFSNLQDVPQPLLNWLTLHEGLAQLFAGREADSRRTFSRLAAREIFGKDPADRKLAVFFIDLGKELESDQAKPASVARDIDKSSYESIALLLYALKAWHLGKYDDAGPLFRQFQSSTPQAPHAWISEYKPLTQSYVEEYAVFRTGVEKARAADTPEKKRAALPEVKAARAQMKLGGELATRLDEAIKQLEQDIAEAAAEEQKKMAEAEAADAPKLAEARTKSAALAAQFRMEEARALAEAVKPASPKYQAEKQTLLKRLDALGKFKKQLVLDLAAGYAGPVHRRNGQAAPPGKVAATEAQIEIRSPYGIAGQVPWTEVHPETIIAMARVFLKADLAPEAAADRQWQLAMYLFTLGRKDAAKELLSAAAEAKPEYRELLPLVLATEE